MPKITKYQKFAMSKPVSKVLDSKMGKGMIGLGNAITRGVRAVKPDMKKVKEDLFGSPERDARQKSIGEALNAGYSGAIRNKKKK